MNYSSLAVVVMMMLMAISSSNVCAFTTSSLQISVTARIGKQNKPIMMMKDDNPSSNKNPFLPFLAGLVIASSAIGSNGVDVAHASFLSESNNIIIPSSTSTSTSTMSTNGYYSTTSMIAVKEIKEGLYFDYEVDVQPQAFDDARSTFKSASETKSNKGKYTALLAILIVGSFIIPMAQYFWYVRDDDSSDNFFGRQTQAPPPPPPPAPKKKGWF